MLLLARVFKMNCGSHYVAKMGYSSQLGNEIGSGCKNKWFDLERGERGHLTDKYLNRI